MLLQKSIWKSVILSFEEKVILALLANRPMTAKQICDGAKFMGGAVRNNMPAAFNSLNHKELLEIHRFEFKKGGLTPYFTIACDWGLKL